MGRPTKLTPAIQKKICDGLRNGLYADSAAILGGICEDTYYEWIKRGEAGDEPYASFSEAVKEATAEAEQNALADVKMGRTGKDDPPHWTSAAWFLERRFPSKYGRRDPDHGLKTKALELEVETLRAKLKLLEAGQNPDGSGVAFIVPGFVAATKVEGENE
jgi:hypothetical protein